MWGVTLTLAALLVVVVTLLAVPVSLAVRVERVDRIRASVRVRWLFGLVDVDCGRPGRRRPRGAKKVAAEKDRRRSRAARAGRGARIGLAVLRTRGLVRRAARLPADLLRRVHVERFHLHATFGFDDPADTGRIYGAVAPLLVAVAASGFDVRGQPSFLEPCLQGSCAATLRMRPLSVLGVVAGFVCSPPVLRAIHAAWRAR